MDKTLWKLLLESYKQSGSENITDEAKRANARIKATVVLFLSLATMIMTVLNIVNRYWFMACTTAALTVGFIICTVLYAFTEKDRYATILVTLLIAGIFSIYAIFGENDGFAILWIPLVPLVSMSILGLRAGTILSLYFQIFLPKKYRGS